MNHKTSFSKLVGSALAHIQSLADDVFHYGFKKLKEVGKEDKKVQPVEEEAQSKNEIARLAKGLARFLGDSGETYYETYEKIKAKKAERAKKE